MNVNKIHQENSTQTPKPKTPHRAAMPCDSITFIATTNHSKTKHSLDYVMNSK